MSKSPRIDAIAGRKVKEWIGKTPDSKVPQEVKDRVLVRWGSICHLSARPIRPGDAWELEHKKPLSMGGEHRESNFRPALKDTHKEKTAQEAQARAKADRQRRASNGTKTAPTTPLQGAGFTPAPPQKKATSVGPKLGQLRALPQPALFRSI